MTYACEGPRLPQHTEIQLLTDCPPRCHGDMTFVLGTPRVGELSDVVAVLREWQCDGTPIQVHPGDLGWFWRFGAAATAAAARTWSRDGAILAVGLLDGPDLLRLAIAPEAQRDGELAQRLVADVTDPAHGVMGSRTVSVESPVGSRVHDLLGDDGWSLDEPWALLRRDLAGPVEYPGLRIEVIGPEQAHQWSAVQRSAFGSTLTDEEAQRCWHAMAAGLPHVDARSLVAYDEQGNAVAAVTVWSAGPGRYGVLEPMGVHREHRGHGYGKAITIAAAAALRELGSSAAAVATTSSNVGAVATYTSAGFKPLPERRDRRRDAP